MQALSEDLLVGAAAAAQFLGMDRSAVYRLTAANELPHVKRGRKIFYRKSELARAFQSVGA